MPSSENPSLLYWLISSEASAANEQAQDASIVASKKTECMPRAISRYILVQTLDRIIPARLESAGMCSGVSCLQIIAFVAGIVIGMMAFRAAAFRILRFS
jgi:hypothetical protein